MIAARVFAVLACIALVAAFGTASLLPPDMPLGQFVISIAPGLLARWRDATLHGIAPLLWPAVEAPVLARPVWVVPAAVGLVSAGLSLTLWPRPMRARGNRRGSGRR